MGTPGPRFCLRSEQESWVRSQPGAGIGIWDPPSILRYSPNPLTVWSCPHHCLPAHGSMAKATGLGFQGHWLRQPLCKMGCWSSALLPHGSCDRVTDNCSLLLAAPELGWAPGRMARLQRAKMGGWSPPQAQHPEAFRSIATVSLLLCTHSDLDLTLGKPQSWGRPRPGPRT